MLNTTETSGAIKTAELAVTYRSGSKDRCFATCPSACALKPKGEQTSDRIDWDYFADLIRAVPKNGAAFTYSHFHWRRWSKRWFARLQTGKPTTTINYSADTWKQARASVDAGIPTVIAVPVDQAKKHSRDHGVRAVQCPATYREGLGCINCGGSVPLCARADRDYVITFPAHGASKKRVGTDQDGGCYAAGGNVRLHWNRLARSDIPAETDGSKLIRFVRGLRSGKILRHHVAGDIGQDFE